MFAHAGRALRCPQLLRGVRLAARFRCFSKMPHSYNFPRPGLTVDTIIVARPQGGQSAAQLLLIQRKNPPCKDQYALPGGFVDENEALETAAARELQEETSVNPADVKLVQVRVYGLMECMECGRS